MRVFWNFIFGLIVLVPYPSKAQLGFALTNNQHKVEFPVEIINNMVVLPVILNGQLPLRFILDTGVRTTILTEKSFSDILRLTYSRHYLVAGPGGEKLVEAYVTNNVTLDIPGIHGEGHAMLVLEKDYLELRNYLGTDVQGVLGYELFSRFVVSIDYERRKLIVMSPDYFKPKRGFQALDILIQDTKPYLYAPVVFKDGTTINAKFMIDSGASHGLVLDPLSDPVIKIPEKHVTSLIGRGLGGAITGQIGRIQALRLGNYQIDNVIANFPDANSYIDTLKSSDVFRNGAIGGELLSRFTVVFNFPKEKIYLKKNSSLKKPFNFNMSGITLKALGARLRKYEVSDVRKGSAADKAGVQMGDELITVNGMPCDELELYIINGFFNARAGKKIRLEFLRDGQKVTKVFALENQI
ncbi:MAG: aspartyl protease family protein [Bacteroidetes bacterium]|nr:aspartyl protease family protein [Bacteroidota bacterium]